MKKAVVFGAGISGEGAKELLESRNYYVYLIDDSIGIDSKKGIEILQQEEIEMVVKSPGIPWEVPFLDEAKNKNIEIISEIELAYRYMDKNIKVISLTGTNGKTTTVTKTYELLEYANYKVCLAGNSGYPFSKIVLSEETYDYVILELSSYQLETKGDFRSNISGIINLTPDHLTRYKDEEDYYLTKLNIFNNQDENDYAIINLSDLNIKNMEKQGYLNQLKAKKIFISNDEKADIYVKNKSIYYKEEEIVEIEKCTLKGSHNVENMMFIISIAKILGISTEKIKEYLYNAKPLEHRLENFVSVQNTIFVNDSKGTNVESTLKAIDAYDNSIILICGGKDKKIDNSNLIENIIEKVSFTYLIGETANQLANDLEKNNYKKYKNLETINNVIEDIFENVDFNKNQSIVFSPASSSFDQFKNFEERGEIFKNLVIKKVGEL